MAMQQGNFIIYSILSCTTDTKWYMHEATFGKNQPGNKDFAKSRIPAFILHSFVNLLHAIPASKNYTLS